MADLPSLAELMNAEVINDHVNIDARGVVMRKHQNEITTRTFRVISTFIDAAGVHFIRCSAKDVADERIDIPVSTDDYNLVNTLLASI